MTIPSIPVKKRTIALIFLAALLAGNAFFLNDNAFRCFNTLDMGGYLDAGWRVFRGQRPFMDFPFHKVPLDLHLSAFFFHLFGFGKPAILAQILVIHSAVILMVFLMLYRRVPLLITLAVTGLTVPSYYWPVSFTWHDQSAHVWGVFGITLLVWKLPFKDRRTAFWIGAACAFLSSVAFMVKSNVGPAWGLAFLAVLLSSRQRIGAVAGYLAGLAAGGLATLLLIRFPREFFEQASAYSLYDGMNRLRELLVPVNWLANYYWAAPAAVFLGLIFTRPRNREVIVLLAGVTLAAIFCVNTGGMIKPANIFLWGIQMALAFIVLYICAGEGRHPWARYSIPAAKIVLSAMTLAFTVVAVRYGLQLKVWTYNDPHPQGDYALQTEPLRGWLCDRKLGVALDEMARFIKTHVPQEDSLLNLTDFYIIYALTGRDSYAGFPPFFFGTAFPAPGPQTERIRDMILQDPPDWIIIHFSSFRNELMFLRLGDEIQQSYTPVFYAGLYLLLHKKG